MSLDGGALALLWFIALYPPVTAAFWIAGRLVYRLLDEATGIEEPPGGWPPLTLLIPAYNERQVIETCLAAARELDYPQLQILVLDDGSTDDTATVAEHAAAGDARVRIVRDQLNRGKAERQNIGFRIAETELVMVCDADTHMHPLAPSCWLPACNAHR